MFRVLGSRSEAGFLIAAFKAYLFRVFPFHPSSKCFNNTSKHIKAQYIFKYPT